jgi:hypothetical protein
MPAKPPHIFPAGVVAEPDVAGAGGPELTTPVGVSIGSAPALGALGTLAIVVAVGA